MELYLIPSFTSTLLVREMARLCDHVQRNENSELQAQTVCLLLLNKLQCANYCDINNAYGAASPKLYSHIPALAQSEGTGCEA